MTNRTPLQTRVARVSKSAWLCGVSFVAATGMSAMSAGPAFAADAAPAPKAAESTTLGDVIVTARRIEERLQDVPIAVSAVGQQKIDDLVIKTQADLVKLAPGVQLGSCNSGGPPGAAYCPLSIRGFSAQLGAGGGAVVTYFADAANFPSSTYDLQNIQVLKGPQGTLFGDTTTGGAVLYVPKKPNGSKGGFIEAEIGNYNERRITAAYENSFADDRVMFRLAGEYRVRQGVTTGHFTWKAGTEKLDDVNSLQLRASLVLKPFENLENYTVAAFQRSETHGGGLFTWYTDPRFVPAARVNQVPSADPILAAQYEFYSGSAPPAGLSWSQIMLSEIARQAAAGNRDAYVGLYTANTTQTHGIVNQTKWTISPHLFVRNIIAVQWPLENDLNYPQEYKGTGNNFDGSDAPILDRSGQRTAAARNAYDGNYYTLHNPWRYRQYTEELQAVGDLFDNRLKWQAGFFYKPQLHGPFLNPQSTELISYANPSAALSLPAATCVSLGGPNQPCYRQTRQSNKTTAEYAQGTFAITDRLNFTAGVRRTKVTDLRTESAIAPTQFVDFTASNGVTIHMPLMVGGIAPYPNAPVVSSYTPGSKSTTYSLTADWKPTDDIMLYIAHRKGFKPGGLNNSAPADSPFRVFGPESLKDVELGAKASWSLGGIQGRSSFAAYRDWYTGIQINLLAPGLPSLVTVNGGQANFHGAEFDTTIQPAPWFEITAQASWTSARYTEYKETSACTNQSWRLGIVGQCADLDPVTGKIVALPGNTPILIDHAKGLVEIQPVGKPVRDFSYRPDRFPLSPYTWSLQPTILLNPVIGHDIRISANIYHRSGETGIGAVAPNLAGVPTFTVQTFLGPTSGIDTSSIPKYTLVDLSADWRAVMGSRVNLWARITNLTDKRYRYSAANFTATNVNGVTLSEPRIYTVGLRYNF